MGSKFVQFFFLYSLLLSTLFCNSNGRKLLNDVVIAGVPPPPPPPPQFDSRLLFLASLPKGKVRNSTPSKKGHAFTMDEKLVARRLGSVDRILRSVPSPGVGH